VVVHLHSNCQGRTKLIIDGKDRNPVGVESVFDTSDEKEKNGEYVEFTTTTIMFWLSVLLNGLTNSNKC
jgi:hypothetical protein